MQTLQTSGFGGGRAGMGGWKWRRGVLPKEQQIVPAHGPLSFISLTHLNLESHKNISKQCRPRSDAAERGVWLGSSLFAFSSEIPTKHGNS